MNKLKIARKFSIGELGLLIKIKKQEGIAGVVM